MKEFYLPFLRGFVETPAAASICDVTPADPPAAVSEEATT
jgi:hypothetical protein